MGCGRDILVYDVVLNLPVNEHLSHTGTDANLIQVSGQRNLAVIADSLQLYSNTNSLNQS